MLHSPQEPYTLPQIAELLNLNPSTVRWWVKDGRLQARKEGRKWVVDREIVEEMIASGTTPGRVYRRKGLPDAAELAETSAEIAGRADHWIKAPDRYGSVEQARIHLQRAEIRWGAALGGFDPYVERLQRLAEAAEEERKALLFAEVCGAPWSSENAGARYSPTGDLKPGNRPGPEGIWKDFDKAVKHLNRASAANSFAVLASAFADLSQAATAVANKLVDGRVD